MSGLAGTFGAATSAERKPVAAPLGQVSNKRTRDCPRVTVRLSPADHARLLELADGMALSCYLRARALGEALPRRWARGAAVEDRAALAQILGLLGQSRIANNLNQLAYQANIGALEMSPDTLAQIDDAYLMIGEIRATLIQALGLKS